MTNLLIGLGVVLSLSTPLVATPMYATEPLVVENEAQELTERVITYKDETLELNITLKEDNQARVFVNLNGTTAVERTTYELLDNGKIKLNSFDDVDYYIFEVNEQDVITSFKVVEPNINNTAEPVEHQAPTEPETPVEPSEPITPVEPETPTEPTEPPFEIKEYALSVGETQYLLRLINDNECELVKQGATEQPIKGKYFIMGNHILLSIKADLPTFVYELGEGNALTPYTMNDVKITLTEAEQKISYWLNQPLPIIGCSTIALLSAILIIISKTSFGRKKYKDLYKRYDELKESNKQAIEDYENIIKEQDKKLKEYKDALITIANNSRNPNIKALREELDNGNETKEAKETTNTETIKK